MREYVAKLVKFGRGGDTVYYGQGRTSSGYGNPDKPHAASGEDIPDGTPAIDTREATETEAGYKWVFKGPMLNPDIADGERDECPEPSLTMVGGLQGAYLSSAALALAHKRSGSKEPGPLDFVGVREYVDGWRRHGARIGQYQGGRIVWE